MTDRLMLKIDLLGTFQVWVGHELADFRTDAERALLAYLAVHQGIPQRRDVLAGLLSPDRSDAEALTYVRNRLTRLRDALHDHDGARSWFEIDRKQITLRQSDAISVDVTLVSQIVKRVESHHHRQLSGCLPCLEALDTALDFVRGELLAGLNVASDVWETWLIGQREHYHQQALAALTHLREARLERHEWADVLAIAQRQLQIEPWLEAAHRAMMTAYYQLGDRTSALAQFEHCHQQLWEELGVEPDPQTQELRQLISDQQVVLAKSPTIPGNLPLQHGVFVGRDEEQAHLLTRLADPNYRLITIVGAGGMGKTRLSIEVGARAKANFSDGVWFVALDAVTSNAEQIKIAIGEAAGLAHDNKQLSGDQVFAILRDKRVLLILDNSEIVLDHMRFIADWLKRAPHLTILTTSREPLNFQAESVLLLQGLPTGDVAANCAEVLFAEHARMADAGFALTAETLPLVRDICSMVDGSPLGIALAAAWVRRRSLSQIRDEIHHSLDFLSSRLRDIEPRHRSMRAVFEASWQLLTADEQTILAKLSIFPDTFTAHAAAAITHAELVDLDVLCEKSLLQQRHESERYVMHGLLRQFARDKLGKKMAIVDHAFITYYAAQAVQHQHHYDRLQPEWRNFAVLISKAHHHKAWQILLESVQALDEAWFRQIRFSEMHDGLTLALDAATALDDPLGLARLLLRLGEIEIEVNNHDQAEVYLLRALGYLSRLNHQRGIAHTKYHLGRIYFERTQDNQALVLFEAAKRIFETHNDTLGIAKNLNLMALYCMRLRDFDQAHKYLQQAYTLQEHGDYTPTFIETLRHLARVTRMLGQEHVSENLLTKAMTVSRAIHELGEYAAVLYEQMLLYKARQQSDLALTIGYQCLETFKQLGSPRWEALVKTQLGLLYQALEQPQRAINFLSEGLTIFIDLDDQYEQAYSYYYIYRCYTLMGDDAQGSLAKQAASRLNEQLHDPQLSERLAA